VIVVDGVRDGSQLLRLGKVGWRACCRLSGSWVACLTCLEDVQRGKDPVQFGHCLHAPVSFLSLHPNLSVLSLENCCIYSCSVTALLLSGSRYGADLASTWALEARISSLGMMMRPSVPSGSQNYSEVGITHQVR